jgi:hypothetical protein
LQTRLVKVGHAAARRAFRRWLRYEEREFHVNRS